MLSRTSVEFMGRRRVFAAHDNLGADRHNCSERLLMRECLGMDTYEKNLTDTVFVKVSMGLLIDRHHRWDIGVFDAV